MRNVFLYKGQGHNLRVNNYPKPGSSTIFVLRLLNIGPKGAIISGIDTADLENGIAVTNSRIKCQGENELLDFGFVEVLEDHVILHLD